MPGGFAHHRGDRFEDLCRRRALGDERRHSPQRRLLVCQARELLAAFGIRDRHPVAGRLVDGPVARARHRTPAQIRARSRRRAIVARVRGGRHGVGRAAGRVDRRSGGVLAGALQSRRGRSLGNPDAVDDAHAQGARARPLLCVRCAVGASGGGRGRSRPRARGRGTAVSRWTFDARGAHCRVRPYFVFDLCFRRPSPPGTRCRSSCRLHILPSAVPRCWDRCRRPSSSAVSPHSTHTSAERPSLHTRSGKRRRSGCSMTCGPPRLFRQAPAGAVLAMHRREELDMRRPIAWLGDQMPPSSGTCPLRPSTSGWAW